MLFRPTNPISHRLARLAFIAACMSALIVAVSGPLHRFLGVDVDTVISLFRYGFYVAAGAIALALATIVPTRPGDRRRGFVAAFLGLVIGTASAWAPLMLFLQAVDAPRINDVSTDTADPPPLVTTLQMRSDAVTPPAYPGKVAADLQHQAYPDIAPIILAASPAEAFKKVDAVAVAMGWEVVARVPGDGRADSRIEAIDSSHWFGLHDDVVVRIRPEGAGSRIDIRSKSRVGRADLGANAQRIHTFMAKLKAL